MSFHEDQLYSLEEKENKRPYKCQNCDASFVQKGNLKVHISAVHEGKNPYKCQSCDARFVYQRSRHIFAVHERKRPYKCQNCEARFVYQSE
jgi:predicted SprT family Zn-dependent metalloprotease